MRILGIDLGSSSVKAIEIDSAFGRFEIHDYHVKKVAENVNPAQTAGLLLRELKKRPDKIVVCLSQGKTTFRTLNLPTKDKKAIRAAVEFELEDELPFEADETAFASSILNQSSQGTEIYVNATLKKHLAELILDLESAGISADVVTSEPWAFYTVFNRIAENTPLNNPAILIQMGDLKTTFYVHSNGKPVASKEITWGGKDISLAISNAYKIPEQDAERAKKENGFILPTSQFGNASKEQKDFSNVVTNSFEKFLTEIRSMIFTCKDQTGMKPMQIYLSGGTSQISGLSAYIQETFGIPTSALKPLSSITSSGVNYSEETEALYSLACGLALTQVGNEKSKVINFRKGEFSKAGQAIGIPVQQLKSPLKHLAFILSCLLISLFIQDQIYTSKMNDLDKSLEKQMGLFFGGLSKSAIRTYLTNTEKLKKSIESEIKKQKEVSTLFKGAQSNPVDFLSLLSSRIPKNNIVLDMIHFEIGSAPAEPYAEDAPKSVVIKALVDNQEQVSVLRNILNSLIDDLKATPPKSVDALDQSGKKIEVTFTGTPKGNKYE